MKITFDMDVNLNTWAEAIGYKIVGDRVVAKKSYCLEDFEKVVADFISESLEFGINQNAIEEIICANDDEQQILREMLEDNYESIEEVK